MISANRLTHYPIFRVLSPEQLEQIAAISEEVTLEANTILFTENEHAQELYILLKGCIELFFTVDVEYHPELRKELYFEVINPGELFGISALIEPYVLTSSARVAHPSVVLKIPAAPLLNLCDQDGEAAYAVIHEIAKAAILRLKGTHKRLAASWTVTG